MTTKVSLRELKANGRSRFRKAPMPMAMPNSLNPGQLSILPDKEILVGRELGGQEAGGQLGDEVAVKVAALHHPQLRLGPIEFPNLKEETSSRSQGGWITWCRPQGSV